MQRDAEQQHSKKQYRKVRQNQSHQARSKRSCLQPGKQEGHPDTLTTHTTHTDRQKSCVLLDLRATLPEAQIRPGARLISATPPYALSAPPPPPSPRVVKRGGRIRLRQKYGSHVPILRSIIIPTEINASQPPQECPNVTQTGVCTLIVLGAALLTHIRCEAVLCADPHRRSM